MRSAVAVLAAAVLLAGCGGGGGMSTAGYRAAATKICEDANRRAAALARPKDLAALRDYLGKTLAIVQQDTGRLKALKPPAALKAHHEAALRLQDEAIARLRVLLQRLTSAKPPIKELQAGLAEVQRLSNQADREFRALGLQRCAQ